MFYQNQSSNVRFRPQPPEPVLICQQVAPYVIFIFGVQPIVNSPDGSETDSRTEACPRITAHSLQKTFQLQTDLF